MNTTQIRRIEEGLRQKHSWLLSMAGRTLAEDMQVPHDERFDEIDQATSEQLQNFEFRLRGRERQLLTKIELALSKMRAGTYGICEECEEPIAPKRLEARPEARLCISCKEEQEHDEFVYAEADPNDWD